MKSFDEKKCIHSGKLIFEHNNVEYWAGDRDSSIPSGIDIYFDLADYRKPEVEISGPLSKYFTNLAGAKATFIKLHWPDGDIPSWNKQNWQDFISALHKIQASKPIKVLISCFAGHGRTGTALAILARLELGIENPIKYIRNKYCQKVVETSRQIEYVAKITNSKEKIKCSKMKIIYQKGGLTNDDVKNLYEQYGFYSKE